MHCGAHHLQRPIIVQLISAKVYLALIRTLRFVP